MDTSDEAAKKLYDFLQYYIKEKRFFREALKGIADPDETIPFDIQVVFATDESTVEAVFRLDPTLDDPSEFPPLLKALCDECLEAAKTAHPELASFTLKHRFSLR